MELIKNLKRTLRGLDEQADELNGFYDAIIRRNDEMAQELDRRHKLNAEVMQALRRCQEMIVKLAESTDGDLRQEGMIYANILEGILTHSAVQAYEEATAKFLANIKLKFQSPADALTESGKVVPVKKPKGKKK